MYCTYLGQQVDNRYCAALSFPTLTKPCYLRPCSLATWRFSNWTACNGSVETRTVQCVNPDGTSADASVSCASLTIFLGLSSYVFIANDDNSTVTFTSKTQESRLSSWTCTWAACAAAEWFGFYGAGQQCQSMFCCRLA